MRIRGIAPNGISPSAPLLTFSMPDAMDGRIATSADEIFFRPLLCLNGPSPLGLLPPPDPVSSPPALPILLPLPASLA